MLKILFWLAAITAFIGPTLGILLGNSQAGWASLVSSLVLMFATRFETVEELSFGPLKAKLREKIEEVENFIEPLNRLALTSSEIALTILMGEGRWGGMGYEEKFKAREQIDNLLDELSIHGNDRDKIYRRWNAYLEFDHAHNIGRGNNSLPRDFLDELNSLHDFRTNKVSEAAEYRKLFVDHNLLTDEINEQIKDLEHFQKSNTIRRYSEWVDRA